MSDRVLTDKQKLFLAALFGEHFGDVEKAKKAAGYSKQYSTVDLVQALQDEILEQSRNYMAVHAPKAAHAVVGIIDDPTQMGGQTRLKAATEILDRIGIVKKDKLEVTGELQGGIFYMPVKDKDKEDADLGA